MRNRPIGVFDSGLGGLTVVKEIRKVLPHESIIYLGDTARVPYGIRSKTTIVKFAKEDVKFLIKKDVKCIVIACNSISSVAVNDLKKIVKIPIFDVVNPTCNYLGSSKKLQKIGIIGTRATVGSNIYKKKIQKFNKNIKIFQKEAPLLVSLIEEGKIEKKYSIEILRGYLNYFKKKKVDTVVLACTHYPVLMSKFKKILGKNVEVINPAKYLAIELENFLERKNLKAVDIIESSYYFGVTDLTSEFKKQVRIFFGKHSNSRLVKVNLTEQ